MNSRFMYFAVLIAVFGIMKAVYKGITQQKKVAFINTVKRISVFSTYHLVNCVQANVL